MEFDMQEGLKKLDRAYKEGRLGFQNGHDDGQFTYEDGSVCAVGAMLDEKFRESIKKTYKNAVRPAELIGDDITVPTGCEELIANDLNELQFAHDSVCSGFKIPWVDNNERLERFKKTFAEMKQKYNVMEDSNAQV